MVSKTSAKTRRLNRPKARLVITRWKARVRLVIACPGLKGNPVDSPDFRVVSVCGRFLIGVLLSHTEQHPNEFSFDTVSLRESKCRTQSGRASSPSVS